MLEHHENINDYIEIPDVVENEDPAVTDLLRIIEATAIENDESDDENNEEENDENMDFYPFF